MRYATPALLVAFCAAPFVLGCAALDGSGDPSSPYLAVLDAPGAPTGEYVVGRLVDADGHPLTGTVWTVRQSGGGSTSVGGQRGEFRVPAIDPDDFNVTVQTTDGLFATGLGALASAEPITVVVCQPGAWLELSNTTDSATRVAVLHDGVRVLDFTLRPNSVSRQLVPAGAVDLIFSAEPDRVHRTVLEPGDEYALAFIDGM